MKIDRIEEGSTTAPRRSSDGSTRSLAFGQGRYAEVIRLCREEIETTGQGYVRTLAHLHLAMAHQMLGQSADARKELEVGRKLLSLRGRASDYAIGNGDRRPLGYNWTEWLYERIVLNEAEALIVYDPVFPANPFAR